MDDFAALIEKRATRQRRFLIRIQGPPEAKARIEKHLEPMIGDKGGVWIACETDKSGALVVSYSGDPAAPYRGVSALRSMTNSANSSGLPRTRPTSTLVPGLRVPVHSP